MKVNARPNLNGNSPRDFREAALAVNNAAIAMKTLVASKVGECFHGRNYQTLADPKAARAEDDKLLHDAFKALDSISALALALHDASGT